MPDVDLSNPILNSPFDPPESHFELGDKGPTGKVLPGRRPSESFIPVPAKKKGKVEDQIEIDFDATGERREANTLINDIRREVERWRANNYSGVTPYTRKLLLHWSAKPPFRDDPVLFCQREAAETAIFLAEVAGRHKQAADYRRRLDPANELHNDGLPRVALKMATGAGKTIVMAMLIAWQTINKAHHPRDTRFCKRFLVVAPGVTIRDRLGVLHPEREDSYYRERDLVPADLWDALLHAQVEIVNYHAFLPRDAKEIKGVAKKTRQLLRGDSKAADAFQETPEMVSARILRSLGSGKGEIIVFNDEAHHCYQDRLLEHPDDDADSDDEERNRDARVWFTGIKNLARHTGVKTVYDLSATPYYLKGSGYNEGYIFPWVVSDFGLMDAIESGIVKVPRMPVDDDASGKEVVYLNLWDNIQPPLPKRGGKAVKEATRIGWTPPATLEAALRSLYKSYADGHKAYEQELAALGEPPPVLIVVCPNTVVSKLVFDWIAGREVDKEDGTTQLVPGELSLLSNVEDGAWVKRQRTILVDSAQLETGEPLGPDFKKAAAHEIEAFKQEYRRRNPGADTDSLTDADLLREAMNTIGKKGKLGEQIRCVVSVAMLTEGWDANTVTHILGIRPFRSQLLCEQVVGRGLRRRSYAADPETNRFAPEYANVYGVPFAFIPSDRTVKSPPPGSPAIEVRALDERAELAIEFPKLDGYRVEVPDDRLYAEFGPDSELHLEQKDVALWTEMGGVVGKYTEIDLTEIRDARPQQVAFALAKRLIEDERFFAAKDGVEKPWLFPQLVSIARRWLAECLTLEKGVVVGQLLLAQACAHAAEKLFVAIARVDGAREPVLFPVINRFDPFGSTDGVRFATRKVVMDPPPEKSHLNHVVLDGKKGNTWEEGLAKLLEADLRVASYVKNERLGFTIPYVHEGRSHDYVPDFLVRLVSKADEVTRTLIVEVSGSQKSPGPTQAKADTARLKWCAAVNNWGECGRWGYTELTNPATFESELAIAINLLLEDAPIIGLPA